MLWRRSAAFIQDACEYRSFLLFILDPISVAGFPPRRPGFEPWSGHVGFVVDKVVLGQVFSEYFRFPCQSSFHQLLHNHPSTIWGLYNRSEMAAVPSGLSPTPLIILIIDSISQYTILLIISLENGPVFQPEGVFAQGLRLSLWADSDFHDI
jgi:hypothetical protein